MTKIPHPQIISINQDSVRNNQTGLGVNGYDSLIGTNFDRGLVLNPEDVSTFSRLHRVCWQIQKVCEYFPDEMTKKWGKLNISTDLKLEKNIQSKIDKLKHIFREGQTWANLYGGALYVRFVEDGKELDEPVDWSQAKSVDYSRVFDRWELSLTLNHDLVTVDPYNPEYYTFFSYSPHYSQSLIRTGQRIHRDRILRFRGVSLPPYEQIINNGWEDSVLQTFLKPLKTYLTGLGYTTEALRNFEIIVLKAMDLHDAMITGNQKKIEERGRAIAEELSSMRPIMMDKSEEDIALINRQFNGVTEIVQMALREMIASSGISPGEFYKEKDQIRANSREERLASASNILARQEKQWGELIRTEINHLLAPYDISQDDWEWSWISTYEQTESENKEDDQLTAQTMQIYISNGVVTSEEVRKSIFDNPDSLITLEETPVIEPRETTIDIPSDIPSETKENDNNNKVSQNTDAVPKFELSESNKEILPESFFEITLEELEAVELD